MVATIRLVVHVRRGIDRPPLSMLSAGLLLVMMGGLDHFDVLSASQIAFGLPASIARAAVVIELGLGAALLTAFAVAVLAAPGGASAVGRSAKQTNPIDHLHNEPH